jgi:hypothetical protein
MSILTARERFRAETRSPSDLFTGPYNGQFVESFRLVAPDNLADGIFSAEKWAFREEWFAGIFGPPKQRMVKT